MDKLHYQGMRARGEFASATPNYVRGLAYGIGAMIFSALIYGLISYFTGYMFYFAGFLIGLFVGYAFSYGAEKITGGIIGLAVFLTIWAVVLGQVFFVAFILMGEGISLVHLGEVLGYYFSEYPENFFLTFFIGLIGAGYVAYYLWKSSKEQRPAIDVVA